MRVLVFLLVVAAVAPAAPSEAAGRPPQEAAMSVVVPGGLAVSGDFRGTGRAQIARLSDPVGDLSLKVVVLDRTPTGESFAESIWYFSGANSFDLSRVKVVAADVNFDGKDDLVVLYDDGETSVRLLVFLSNGGSFTYTGNQGWWSSRFYAWSRVQHLIAGNFSAYGHTGLLLTYQYDNFRMRIHYFESTGTSFSYSGDQGAFDTERSGLGGYDLSKARFAAGRFTRSGGAQQLAAMYQYPNFRVRVHVFEPTPNGLVAINGWSGVYDSGEGQYELARARLAAADVNADGRTDLVSLYGYADGSVRVHVFSGAASFQPLGGFSSWASFPSGALSWSSTGLVAGDWNGDGAGDAATLALLTDGSVRASSLRSALSRFCLAGDPDPLCADRWPLLGKPANGGPTWRRPLHVRVDNVIPARPHYGISQADMVFEMLVEGYVTRFAAVFHSQDPEVIGGIRSGRLSDRSTTPMVRGALVYSGATIEETALFKQDAQNGHYLDLNGSYYGWPYRVGFRPGPYNEFSSAARMRDTANSIDPRPVQVPSWAFLPVGSVAPAGGFGSSVAAGSLTIPYRAGSTVGYVWTPWEGGWARWQNGVQEVDAANGATIFARNVVVIQTDIWETDIIEDIFNSRGLDMRLIGTGAASIFRDGRRQDGIWSRATHYDPFTFRTTAGEPILLGAGQTWVHVIPTSWSAASN